MRPGTGTTDKAITLLQLQKSPHRGQSEQISASDDLPKDCTDHRGHTHLPVPAVENSLQLTSGNFIGDHGDVVGGVPQQQSATAARASPKEAYTLPYSFTNI
jgi:hypothetical protein